MKAIIATGFGKLHFHETARALAAAGVEVNFLTGWVPKDNQTALVDLVGRSLGEKHLAARMAARKISIPGATVTPIAWAEVAGTFIKLVQKTRVIPLDLAYGMEFRLAALGSRKYLKNADVLLVRSGAGQSGAIRKARGNGMAVVTDHSIAHPAFMHAALREEFARFGMAAGYDSRADLWKLVLRDCDEALRIDPDRPLSDYGLDSLGNLELRTRIETETGVRIQPTHITTVRGLADHLCEQLESKEAALANS